jgi:hypothetical protein
MLAYGCVVEKNPCTVGLCNLNTTYHFLGKRQTARYFNYSNSQFKSTPFILYCSYLANHLNSILPVTHIEQIKFKYLNSIGYLTYHYSLVFFSILASLVSSLCLSHSFTVSIILLRFVLLTTNAKPLHLSLH